MQDYIVCYKCGNIIKRGDRGLHFYSQPAELLNMEEDYGTQKSYST